MIVISSSSVTTSSVKEVCIINPTVLNVTKNNTLYNLRSWMKGNSAEKGCEKRISGNYSAECKEGRLTFQPIYLSYKDDMITSK